MVYRLERTQQSEDDMFDIWSYITEDNPAAADRLAHDLLARIRQACIFPNAGRAVPEISPQHRVLTQGSYLLVYHVDDVSHVVTLVRVLHAARDWLKLFERD